LLGAAGRWANGLMALDPDSSWKDMKKAGRKLFQALGELRDVQVIREWIERLNDRKSFSYSPGDRLSGDHVSGNHAAINLLNHVHARESESK
jgi:hypothetical protein